MPESKLTSRGQTVIPKVIRDRLGLRPGDKLDYIIQENGDVLMRPATVDIRTLKGMLHRPGLKALSVEQMNEVIQKRGGQS